MEFSSSTDAQLHSWTPVPALESGPCGSFHTFLLPENPQKTPRCPELIKRDPVEKTQGLNALHFEREFLIFMP